MEGTMSFAQRLP